MMAVGGGETQRSGERGGVGAYEAVAHATGVVVLARDGLGPQGAAFERVVCDVLRGYRLSMLRITSAAQAQGEGERAGAELLGLVHRVLAALDWLRDGGHLARQGVGLLGIELGAAAVLQAAAQRPGCAAAVVSGCGRPDGVAACLSQVQAATLLIAGAGEPDLVQANRLAMRTLTCPKRLEIVPGARPLRDEPAALDAAAHLAGTWFVKHLSPRRLQ